MLILTILLFFNFTIHQRPQGLRREAPREDSWGQQYYYDSTYNPFYPKLAPYYKTKEHYVIGNCTWYAWGRVCEIAGKKLPYVFTGDAGSWWDENRKKGWYAYGSQPKKGAIICYDTHVGVVEQVQPLTVSESGWKLADKKDAIVFNCGAPWRREETAKGYIYVNGR